MQNFQEMRNRQSVEKTNCRGKARGQNVLKWETTCPLADLSASLLEYRFLNSSLIQNLSCQSFCEKYCSQLCDNEPKSTKQNNSKFSTMAAEARMLDPSYVNPEFDKVRTVSLNGTVVSNMVSRSSKALHPWREWTPTLTYQHYANASLTQRRR
jgi:hypothetical protein